MFSSTGLIYASIFGFIVLVVLRRPSVAMGAFMCTYGLEQWAQSRNSWFFINSSLTNMATAGLLVWALVVRQIKGQGTLGDGVTPMGWVIIALFGWSAASILWSIDGGSAIGNWKSSLPYLAASIVLLPLTIRNLADVKAGLLMTVLLGVFILLLLLTTTDWDGRTITLQGSAASIKSNKGNPLAIASLAGWIALIALLCNFRGLGPLMVVVRYSVVLLGLVIAMRSGSRGQVFALVTAGLLFLPASRGLQNAKQIVLLTISAITTVVVAVLTFQFLGLGESTRWSSEEMFETYGNSRLGPAGIVIERWWDEGPITWIFGLGTSASYHAELIGFYPHLVALEVLGELGVVGFVLLCIVAFGTIITTIRLSQIAPDLESRGVAAAMGGLFMFEVILSFKQGSLLGTPFSFGFALILARMWQQAKQDGYLASAGAMIPQTWLAAQQQQSPQAEAADQQPHWLDDMPARGGL
jgi:hypothetical protein